MNNTEFDKIVDDVISQIRNVLQNKAKEYARKNDRLSNFKRAAQLKNCSPERALEGMMTKHIVSIYDYLDDLETSNLPTLESWDEKIGDTINYLILLKALLKERYE